MAKYTDFYNSILKAEKPIDEPWEGKTGKEVEDFICRRFSEPLGKTMTYEKNILTIYNPEGEAIATGEVTPVDPTYVVDVTFSELKIDSTVYTTGVEVNFNEDQRMYAGVNVKTYYIQSGNNYNLPNKVNLVFSIEGDTQQYIIENVSPKSHDDNTLEYFDITSLLQRKLSKDSIRVSVTTSKESGSDVFENVTIHKIELTTNSTYVDNKTITFNIDGLNATGDMRLEYYDVELGTNPKNVKSDYKPLSSSTYTELELQNVGPRQILARITNPEHTFYSNWVQANVIAFDSSNKQEMMVNISGIPSSITNCENANLYKIICVPGTGGSAEIISYLSDEAGMFSKADWSEYEFNRTSITTTSNDSESTSDYYTYIELPEVDNNKKFVAFKLKLNDVEYPVYQLYIDHTNTLNYRNYFVIDIKENPYNINNAFNYTEGAKDNFSQITGQSTSLFTNINPNIEASDGWSVDNNLVCYKISGQNKNLFIEPKDMSDLLNSDNGFSIEVMLKNYNVNGEDPVMKIGNLLFGPGFTRIEHVDKSDEGIYVNSRADYEKDVITHLMFVFDPTYKPVTYLDTYDKLFTEGNESYSTLQHNYPILKVYVNGCINREIEVTRNDLKDSDGFKLQICPKSSDLNLYIFRTYRKALDYNQIQKNFISSRASSQEKKEFYDRNDILGSDGKISFYKSLLKHNVLVFVLPKEDKPLFFGNRQTTGDGLGSDGTGKSKATILVHYKDERYKNYCGRFTGGKYKAQGSSAKKYMIHNTQYSKGKFLSEAQIAEGITEGVSSYVIPTDPEQIAAKKLVGKVNYASSMQSHKQGAIKLYDRAYKEIFGNDYLYNGGKKACLEEAFMYFYYNVDDDSQLDSITIDDLYTVKTVNNITVADDSKVKFMGFQTWGSAKADDPTYGYDEDKTPEYLLVEGADNASPGANFKQPWAAFQTWDSTKTRQEHKSGTGVMTQQTEAVTNKFINGQPNPNYDPTKGILIEGETIRFETDTDPWDIDYGLELYIKEGESKKYAEDRDLWVFNDKVKNSSLQYFVDFYNNCYQYDFTNLLANPNDDQGVFDLTNSYKSVDKRIYMTQRTKLYEGDANTGNTANLADVYRWDILKGRWVPAGLHFNGSSWSTYNLVVIYSKLKSDPLYLKYKDTLRGNFYAEILGPEDIPEYVIPAFRDMFMATVEEYCDKDDIAYHQAFIRLVSGTDNRAKNTYFQIIGKLYANGEPTDVGDYKIRLMQDDLDTIFATDNNGQQVKPYYLLEPPFNKDTEEMWGDAHSAFFYPFDVCYYELINEYLGKLIKHLVAGATSVKDVNTNLNKYFFETQLNFPEIAYNHHAEIYYEMPQMLFSNGDVLTKNGQTVFNSIIGDFKNNNVKNPLSLSHGRCLESEYQFMKDRLLMLGTSTLEATNLYSSDYIKLSDYSTGGDISNTTTLKGKATYTDYFYPVRSTTSGGTSYIKIGKITDEKDVSIKYDPVFSHILEQPKIPSVLSELVTPREKPYDLISEVNVGMGAFLNAGSKYKTMEITNGLDYSTRLLHLPNAKSLVINGATANYHVTDTDIKVKNFLPIIENLVINNTQFGNSVLDFRGCNRLENLNLSGCTDIIDIVFPENNRLNSVYLPSGLKKITIGKNPNLSTFVFAEGTALTEISLDCSNLHDDFDYIDLLENKVDYANLKQFILKNTPESGLKITESIALKLAEVKNSGITSVIKGKFVITDRVEEVQSGITYNTWGNMTDIGYNTKKHLVKAFGNIDSNSNEVYCLYTMTQILSDSYVLPRDISVDSVDGGTFKPFDGLYFRIGNNIAIKDGKLDITYSVSGLPAGYSVNSNTGELTTKGNTGNKYSYSITVNTLGGKLDPITGYLHLSYIEPTIGDFAYSDGTFSQHLDSEKTLVGLVYQKEVVHEGQEWKLGILSNEVVKNFAGPAYYNWDTSSTTFTNIATSDQDEIWNFMTSPLGLGIDASAPDVHIYTGLNGDDFLDTNKLSSIKINYNSYSDEDLNSFEIKEDGLQHIQKIYATSLDRMHRIISNNSKFKSYLSGKGFLDNQGKVNRTWTSKDLPEVFNKFIDAATSAGFDKANYHKVLNPLSMMVVNFEPQNLLNKGEEYYKKGNWYIPTVDELSLLVWYRIRSTATPTTANSESYWNSVEYSKGTDTKYNIFSNKSSEFASFLSSDLIASEITPINMNAVYGQHSYYAGSDVVTRYGWHYTYDKGGGYWDPTHHNSSRRDFEYTVAPCCVITVTKN